MDSTSELLIERHGDIWRIFIPVPPVPASRPRFARSGRVYYGKNYTKFRRVCGYLFGEVEFPPEFPLQGCLVASATFVVTRPRTTKRASPRGDVDNYFKSLDVLNMVVWGDDDQLVWASMAKEFGDTPGIILEVMEIEPIPETRTLSEMWFKK